MTGWGDARKGVGGGRRGKVRGGTTPSHPPPRPCRFRLRGTNSNSVGCGAVLNQDPTKTGSKRRGLHFWIGFGVPIKPSLLAHAAAPPPTRSFPTQSHPAWCVGPPATRRSQASGTFWFMRATSTGVFHPRTFAANLVPTTPGRGLGPNDKKKGLGPMAKKKDGGIFWGVAVKLKFNVYVKI